MEGILIEMESLAPAGVYFAGLILLALVVSAILFATRPRRRSGASGCTGQSGRSPDGGENGNVNHRAGVSQGRLTP